MVVILSFGELAYNHSYSSVQSFCILSSRGGKVRLSSSSTLNLFRCFPHHVARMKSFCHQVVAHHHRQVRFPIRRGCPHEHHLLRELSFQLVRYILNHFRRTDRQHQSEERNPVDLFSVVNHPLLHLLGSLLHVLLDLFFHLLVIRDQSMDALHHIRNVIQQ